MHTHTGISFKDLVGLLQYNGYLSKKELINKGELIFLGDKLVYGGVKGSQTNSVKYRECRYYNNKELKTCCNYFFVRISYNSYVLAKVPKCQLFISMKI